MVFQNYALFPHMTVGENLAFPLKVRKMASSEVDEKVRKALDMVQMVAFIDRKPAQLSGGQQQRVAVARALIGAPPLIVADEPTSALDAATQDSFLSLLFEQCARAGSALLMVSHDERLGARFDRVVDLADIVTTDRGTA